MHTGEAHRREPARAEQPAEVRPERVPVSAPPTTPSSARHLARPRDLVDLRALALSTRTRIVGHLMEVLKPFTEEEGGALKVTQHEYVVGRPNLLIEYNLGALETGAQAHPHPT